MTQAIVLYATPLSGHCHRVELLLRMLDLPYRIVEAFAPVRATAEFRRLNPYGQVPALEDGEVGLADSNAILVYLAKRYGGGRWLPEDPVGAARVQRWLSFAAGEIAFGPARARFLRRWGPPGASVEAQAEIAARALAFMDEHLQASRFLVDDTPTIADLACYAYVAHAPEGGIALEPFQHIRAWIARVESLPGFKPLPLE